MTPVEDLFGNVSDIFAALKPAGPGQEGVVDRVRDAINPPEPVQSSNLAAVQRRRGGGMDVLFRNGSRYRYKDVPDEVYKGLMDAPSKGSYFWKNIRKGPYSHGKVRLSDKDIQRLQSLREKTASRLEMAKFGAVTATLEPHQERVRQKMQSQDGLVVAHGLGSGKTLSSIAAMDDVAEKAKLEGRKARVRAVTPASLKANMVKEIGKHTEGGVDADVKLDSHARYTRNGQPEEEKLDMLVVDEAHRARSVGSKLKNQLKHTDAKKRMLLTATPVYNHPYEVGPLVNIAAGRYLLPETEGEFSKRFVSQEKVYPKGLKGLAYRMRGGEPGERPVLKPTPELRDTLQKYVDYHETDKNSEDFPRLKEERVDVPMSKKQEQIYRYMMQDLPPELRKKVLNDLPPTRQEASQLLSFLNGPRQVANSVNGFDMGETAETAGADSAKIQAILEKVKADKGRRRLIYSNYLDSGLNPLRSQLDAEGVPYGVFTGSESKKDRNAAVQAFNNGDLSTLLVSSAGGEGLDLRGVREVHVMEPHWNEQKINQVIGRARRYGSHAHLSPEEREVNVYRYLSSVPRRGPIASPSNAVRRWMGRPLKTDVSAEHYIQNRSQEKQDLNDQMINLMKTGSAFNVARGLTRRAPSGTSFDDAVKNITPTARERAIRESTNTKLKGFNDQMMAPRKRRSSQDLSRQLRELSDGHIASDTLARASNARRSMFDSVSSTNWAAKAPARLAAPSVPKPPKAPANLAPPSLMRAPKPQA